MFRKKWQFYFSFLHKNPCWFLQKFSQKCAGSYDQKLSAKMYASEAKRVVETSVYTLAFKFIFSFLFEKLRITFKNVLFVEFS